MRVATFVGSALAFLVSLVFPAAAQQEVIALKTRPGVTQSYFLTSAPKDLRAIAVLFPGGGGFIHLRVEDGKNKFDADNFLVRSRSDFINRGVIAAIVDAPSDQQKNWGMTDEFRMSAEHLNDISAVVVDLKKRVPAAPLFLIGTSRGTISAAAIGAKLDPPAAGVALSATVFRATSRGSPQPGPGLSKFDFATIKVPLLFVHHGSDQCATTLYGDAYRLSEKYPLISVLGGKQSMSDPCEALSQHGFYGKEAETVEEIVNWMLKKPYKDLVK